MGFDRKKKRDVFRSGKHHSKVKHFDGRLSSSGGLDWSGDLQQVPGNAGRSWLAAGNCFPQTAQSRIYVLHLHGLQTCRCNIGSNCFNAWQCSRTIQAPATLAQGNCMEIPLRLRGQNILRLPAKANFYQHGNWCATSATHMMKPPV